MLKRKLLVILSLLLTLSFLAGCQTATSQPTTTTKAPDVTTTGEGTTAPTEETVTISIGWQDSMNFGKDNLATFLENKFNIKLQFINLSWSDFLEKLTAMASAGELPDMFMHPTVDSFSSKPIFYQWVEQGVIRPLPDDLTKYPVLNEMMQSFNDIMRIDGKFYQVPRFTWKPENVHFSQGCIYRKDYLANVGITSAPTSIDEFYAMLVAFRDKDADKNGTVGDTIPFSVPKNGMEFLELTYGVPYNSWLKEDGQYIPAYLSRNYLECVKFQAKLFDEGLLDPDFATQDVEQIYDKFSTGRVACYAGQIEAQSLKSVLVDRMSKLMEGAADVLGVAPITKGPFGDPVYGNQFNHWSGTLFNANVDDVKMDRCMQLFNWALSDEGLRFFRWGIEGEDYKLEDGKPVSLLPIEPTTGLPQTLYVSKPTSSLKSFFTWDVDGYWELPGIPAQCIELEKEHIRVTQKYIQQDAGARITYLSAPELNAFSYMDLIKIFFQKSVLGQYDDIDAEFEKMKNEVLTTRGGNDAIRVANELVK